jgi:hypothetical protein
MTLADEIAVDRAKLIEHLEAARELSEKLGLQSVAYLVVVALEEVRSAIHHG